MSFKALALGAKFCVCGEVVGVGDGVRHVTKELLAGLDILMHVAGCQSRYRSD